MPTAPPSAGDFFAAIAAASTGRYDEHPSDDDSSSSDERGGTTGRRGEVEADGGGGLVVDLGGRRIGLGSGGGGGGEVRNHHEHRTDEGAVNGEGASGRAADYAPLPPGEPGLQRKAALTPAAAALAPGGRGLNSSGGALTDTVDGNGRHPDDHDGDGDSSSRGAPPSSSRRSSSILRSPSPSFSLSTAGAERVSLPTSPVPHRGDDDDEDEGDEDHDHNHRIGPSAADAVPRAHVFGRPTMEASEKAGGMGTRPGGGGAPSHHHHHPHPPQAPPPPRTAHLGPVNAHHPAPPQAQAPPPPRAATGTVSKRGGWVGGGGFTGVGATTNAGQHQQSVEVPIGASQQHPRWTESGRGGGWDRAATGIGSWIVGSGAGTPPPPPPSALGHPEAGMMMIPPTSPTPTSDPPMMFGDGPPAPAPAEHDGGGLTTTSTVQPRPPHGGGSRAAGEEDRPSPSPDRVGVHRPRHPIIPNGGSSTRIAGERARVEPPRGTTKVLLHMPLPPSAARRSSTNGDDDLENDDDTGKERVVRGYVVTLPQGTDAGARVGIDFDFDVDGSGSGSSDDDVCYITNPPVDLDVGGGGSSFRWGGVDATSVRSSRRRRVLVLDSFVASVLPREPVADDATGGGPMGLTTAAAIPSEAAATTVAGAAPLEVIADDGGSSSVVTATQTTAVAPGEAFLPPRPSSSVPAPPADGGVSSSAVAAGSATVQAAAAASPRPSSSSPGPAADAAAAPAPMTPPPRPPPPPRYRGYVVTLPPGCTAGDSIRIRRPPKATTPPAGGVGGVEDGEEDDDAITTLGVTCPRDHDVRSRQVIVVVPESDESYDAVLQGLVRTLSDNDPSSSIFRSSSRPPGMRTPTPMRGSMRRVDSWKHRRQHYPRKHCPVGESFQATDIPPKFVSGDGDGGAAMEETSELYYEQIWDPERAAIGGSSSRVFEYMDSLPYSLREIGMVRMHENDYCVKRTAIEMAQHAPALEWSPDERKKFHRTMMKTTKDVNAVARSLGRSVSDVLTYYYGSYRHTAEGRALQSIVEREGTRSDYCVVCADGGHLMCCEGCNDPYHLQCLTPPLQEVPAGDWHCPQCVLKENTAAAKRRSDAGLDSAAAGKRAAIAAAKKRTEIATSNKGAEVAKENAVKENVTVNDTSKFERGSATVERRAEVWKENATFGRKVQKVTGHDRDWASSGPERSDAVVSSHLGKRLRGGTSPKPKQPSPNLKQPSPKPRPKQPRTSSSHGHGPIYVDAVSRIAYYDSMDLTPPFSNYDPLCPIVLNARNADARWTVRLGDVVAVHCDSAYVPGWTPASQGANRNNNTINTPTQVLANKWFPFVVPWTPCEIVNIWYRHGKKKGDASSSELDGPKTDLNTAVPVRHARLPGGAARGDDKVTTLDIRSVTLEVRWLYRPKDIPAALSKKISVMADATADASYLAEEVFETGHISECLASALLAPIKLQHPSASFAASGWQYHHSTSFPNLFCLCHKMFHMKPPRLSTVDISLKSRLKRARQCSHCAARSAGLRKAMEQSAVSRIDEPEEVCI